MTLLDYLLPASLAALWLLVFGLAISVLRVQLALHKLKRALEGRASEGPELGTRAPDLKRGTVVSADGSDRAAGLLGYPGIKVVWFMGVGCRPCRSLRPTLSVLADEYEGRVTTIVNCIGHPETVLEFGSPFVSSIVLLADPDRLNATKWRVATTPFAIVVDGAGVVRKKFASTRSEEVQLALDVLLAETAAETKPTDSDVTFEMGTGAEAPILGKHHVRA